ncbi:MAG: class C sortase [Defluviitaleaceae bacterium]|nr:class C sortase [Defluviitaleaceae bacterium]
MRKKHILTIFAFIFMISGFTLLFYPDISNLQKTLVHDAILREYDRMVSLLTPEQVKQQLHRAATHNTQLSSLESSEPLLLGDIAILPYDYNQTLYVQGVMAWIDIPTIDVSLPVLHGTGPNILSRGVGHLEGTAFPIGGYGTHSVLTTHSGLAGVRLFTDLHLLNYGDIFFVSVLGQRLAYKVDQIYTVLPHEIELLRVTPGKDLMTLITCTPITINTHRLLVRGVRVPYAYYMQDEVTVMPISTGFRGRVVVFAAFLVVHFFIWRERRNPPIIEHAT